MRLADLVPVTILALSACIPDLPDDSSVVRSPRILAVQATPAEAKPGVSVTLTALVGAPPSAAPGEPLRWALCTARRPLTELGPVAQECVDGFGSGSEALVRLADGITTAASIPGDACRNFGPSTPPADASGVSGRPVDPDASGGYHQPIVVGDSSTVVLASVRLSCGVVGVPNGESVTFARDYRANENPAVEALELDGAVVPTGGAHVASGARVELRAVASPPESYVWANPATRRVEPRMEELSFTWFASDGSFAEARTSGASTWTAPRGPGPVRVWVVARDDRGGVGWTERTVFVDGP